MAKPKHQERPGQHFCIMVKEAEVTDKGNYTFHDFFTGISSSGVPFQHDFLTLTFWGRSFVGEHTGVVELYDPRDRKLAWCEPAEFAISDQRMNYLLSNRWKIVFEDEGTYHWRILTDDEVSLEVPFDVEFS